MGIVWRILIIVLLAVAATLPAPTAGTTMRRAGLVVHLSADEVVTRCVAFGEERISGATLLARSGLAVATSTDSSYGAFVCGIAGVGCPADNCLCAYPPSYWHYWLRQPNGWRSSPVGASTRTLSDGDVDGWVWPTGDADGSVPPPALTFEQICPTERPWRLWLPLLVR